MNIVFFNETQKSIEEELFRRVLKSAIKEVEPLPERSVELILIEDERMREINRDTRGMDKTTDVLSFANREVKEATLRDTTSLGQIFISISAAQRNADEMNQSLEEELRFLFLHGFLHILGYDHQNQRDETEMMTLAYRILGRPPYRSGTP